MNAAEPAFCHPQEAFFTAFISCEIIVYFLITEGKSTTNARHSSFYCDVIFVFCAGENVCREFVVDVLLTNNNQV